MAHQSKPQSALTHVAIHVRDMKKTVEFYEKYTGLAKIHERLDGQAVALANDSQQVVLRSNIVMSQAAGFRFGKLQHLAHTWSIGCFI